jgi:hypothetical protein
VLDAVSMCKFHNSKLCESAEMLLQRLPSATMAPPESNAVDFQQPQQVGTFDTQNYQTRIKEYYRKLDGYKLITKQVDISTLRYASITISTCNT